MVRDKTYNRPLGRATHRYPTRNIIEQVEKKQIIEKITQMDEPPTNENIPPFLLNVIIDDDTGEVDIKALIHGIKVLETKVNEITCPETGKKLEYRHLIQNPATKAVWKPAMSTEVDRLIDTETTKFLKKKNVPLGETAVYTRLVVDMRPKRSVHERLRMCMGGDRM